MAMKRICSARSLLLISLALAGCEGSTGPTGPEGPAGESGPGTRITFSGIFGEDGLSGHLLPSEAGTPIDLPSATCWVSEDGIAWFEFGCGLLVDIDGSLFVVAIGDPGWRYRIAVVY